MAVLVKFEINLNMYIEITRYLVQECISQRSQKYLNSKLFIILISLDIQWDHPWHSYF